MIAAMGESWVTILVLFSFGCGVMLGSSLTWRLRQYDLAEYERNRGR